MEVVRSSGYSTAKHDHLSRGYASVYGQFHFPNIDQDREALLEAALDRLEALKEISNQMMMNGRTEEVLNTAREAERKYGLLVPSKGADRMDMIFRDECSHFLLRIALSQSPEQRDFLLKTESRLLEVRLTDAGRDAVFSVLKEMKEAKVKQLTDAEMADRELRMELETVARGPRRSREPLEKRYYKVDFSLVSSHLAQRRVLLRDGLAYVPEKFLVDILVSQFRASLSKSLADISRTVSFVKADHIFAPLIVEIQKNFFARGADAGKSSSRAEGDLKLEELRGNAVPGGMPLCMINLLAKLREDHHLKHGGRLQLGLFLKSCGLSMDESLNFWRDEFARGRITPDVFEKQYAYSIRHVYGKEGRRKELGCFGCMKIINNSPTVNEHHGCPYKEFSEKRLRETLSVVRVPEAAVSNIVNLAKNHHYQLACSATFNATQPIRSEDDEITVSNPAEYFVAARILQQRSNEEAAMQQ